MEGDPSWSTSVWSTGLGDRRTSPVTILSVSDAREWKHPNGNPLTMASGIGNVVQKLARWPVIDNKSVTSSRRTWDTLCVKLLSQVHVITSPITATNFVICSERRASQKLWWSTGSAVSDLKLLINWQEQGAEILMMRPTVEWTMNRSEIEMRVHFQSAPTKIAPVYYPNAIPADIMPSWVDFMLSARDLDPCRVTLCVHLYVLQDGSCS